MKLQLKHLAPYLPYGLKTVNFNVGNLLNKPLISEMIASSIMFFADGTTEAKPILRPLSDLTKEIEINGEKFVPIIQLVKIVSDIHNNDMDDKFIISDTGRILVKTPWDLKVEMFYKTKSICWAIYDTWNNKEKRTINQYVALEKLLEWHFDIFNLIENNLAIDINTLKK